MRKLFFLHINYCTHVNSNKSILKGAQESQEFGFLTKSKIPFKSDRNLDNQQSLMFLQF